MTRFILQINVNVTNFVSDCIYQRDTFTSALADDVAEKFFLHVEYYCMAHAPTVEHVLRVHFSTRREFAKLPAVIAWAKRAGYPLFMYPPDIADYYDKEVRPFDPQAALEAACWYERS